ncbi:hypothetical protein ACFOQM_23445 [Paenibacillus sp. GCM10012307]|uniref:Uncharacterized protein n=1 Tax=Paenibacillus roseus TaxID=2798579 RepID=A0A934MTF5_9BACL|nr:hypothetical protein [Paenibacillus roseus]MBJ6364179.1 hypothetical protein [Paenibacillus roseus]
MRTAILVGNTLVINRNPTYSNEQSLLAPNVPIILTHLPLLDGTLRNFNGGYPIWRRR